MSLLLVARSAVVPTWLIVVGVAALSLPAPGIAAGLLLLVATVLVVPAVLTALVWNMPVYAALRSSISRQRK